MLRATNNAIIPQDGTVTQLETGALSSLNKIEEVAIPNGVLTIPTYFAVDCTNLDRLTLPNTITKIDTQAFYRCHNLCKSSKKLVIPDSVTVINSNAFSQCENIEEVVLPKSLRDMGSGSNFADCTGLKVVKFRSADTPVNEYGDGAFERCTNLTDVYWPGKQSLAETTGIWSHMGIDTTKVTIHYEYEVRD